MCESKVESLRSLIFRSPHILHLLLSIQLRPLRLPSLILSNIVVLNKPEQQNIEAADPQQNLVPSRVQRLIIFTINVRSDDVPRLNEHVVQCSRDGSCADGIGVAAIPGYQNGMAVGVGE